MADGTTSHYGWILPENHVNANAWGGPLNANLQDIDGKLFNDVANMTAIKSYLNPNTLVLTRGPAINASINFINSAAPAGKQTRWSLYESFGGETGGNVGSDYSLNAYDDTGVMLRAQYVFNRANGNMTFNGVAATFNCPMKTISPEAVWAPSAGASAYTGYFDNGGTRQGYVGYIFSNTSMTMAKDGGTSIVLTSGISLNGPTVVTGALTGSSTAAFTGITGTSLTVNGGAAVTGTATIGTLAVTGNATVTGTLTAGALTVPSATVNGNLNVTGTGTFGSFLSCKAQLNTTANAGTNAIAQFFDSAAVRQGYCGWLTTDDSINLAFDGGAIFKLTSVAAITGNTTVTGTFLSSLTGTLGNSVGAGVAGAVTKNALNIYGATATDNTYVNFYDNASVAQGLVGWQKATNNLLLQNTGGASITIGGTLAVTLTGNTTVTGTLTSTGAASFPALTATGLTVNGNGSITGTLTAGNTTIGALTATSAQINGNLTATGVGTFGIAGNTGAMLATRNQLTIQGGTATSNAYTTFLDSAGAQQGYMGWRQSDNSTLLVNTGGAYVQLTSTALIQGNTAIGGTLTSSGAASFPALTATSAQVNGALTATSAQINGTLSSTGVANLGTTVGTGVLGLQLRNGLAITGGTATDSLAVNFYNSAAAWQGGIGWNQPSDTLYFQNAAGTAAVSLDNGTTVNITGNASCTGTLAATGAIISNTAVSCKSSLSISGANSTDGAYTFFYNSAGTRQGFCGWQNSGDIIYLANDGGANIGITNSIALTGVVNTSSTLTAGGAISAPSLAATQGAVVITAGTVNASPTVSLRDGAGTVESNFYWSNTLGTIMNDQVRGTALQLDFGTNFKFNGSGNAYKAGAGGWLDASDLRIKNELGGYTSGLDEVLQLRPVRYTFKGNDTPSPDDPSPHKHVAESGKQFVGLIAQEVEAIFPTMVTQRAGYIDGQAVTDLRDLDTSELIFALVNSVKELKAEIEALKNPVVKKGR